MERVIKEPLVYFNVNYSNFHDVLTIKWLFYEFDFFLGECPVGFYGTICEQDINVCDYAVCRNNGTCIDGYGANYSCICPPGYSGQSCNVEMNECDKSSCLNGGTCVEVTPGSFKCSCIERFAGKNCEIGMCFFVVIYQKSIN